MTDGFESLMIRMLMTFSVLDFVYMIDLVGIEGVDLVGVADYATWWLSCETVVMRISLRQVQKTKMV
jgi:hypothetical protein